MFSNLYFCREKWCNSKVQAANCTILTITRDSFKGLRHFAKLFSDHIPWGRGLVYGGNETQEREDVSIVPFKDLNRLLLLPMHGNEKQYPLILHDRHLRSH
jgi:hypothetical protein